MCDHQVRQRKVTHLWSFMGCRTELWPRQMSRFVLLQPDTAMSVYQWQNRQPVCPEHCCQPAGVISPADGMPCRRLF
jgi:hypothetical protein